MVYTFRNDVNGRYISHAREFWYMNFNNLPLNSVFPHRTPSIYDFTNINIFGDNIDYNREISRYFVPRPERTAMANVYNSQLVLHPSSFLSISLYPKLPLARIAVQQSETFQFCQLEGSNEII